MADKECLYRHLIVGGGPGGLSTALWLGRCCRRVLVCDAHDPRNLVAHHVRKGRRDHPAECLGAE